MLFDDINFRAIPCVLREQIDWLLTRVQQLTGTTYPSKLTTRILCRDYRSIRSRDSEISRNKAIYLSITGLTILYHVRLPELGHQYQSFIKELKDQPDLDFTEVTFRLLQITYGIVGRDDEATKQLRQNIKRELPPETE